MPQLPPDSQRSDRVPVDAVGPLHGRRGFLGSRSVVGGRGGLREPRGLRRGRRRRRVRRRRGAGRSIGGRRRRRVGGGRSLRSRGGRSVRSRRQVGAGAASAIGATFGASGAGGASGAAGASPAGGATGAETKPANSNGVDGALGVTRSKSAEAIALVSVSGAEASTAVSAAMRSVWRTFFNIVPFAGARAEASPAMWVACRFLGRLDTSNRAVSIRHDSRGVSQHRAVARRPHGGVVAVRSPRSHAGPWFRSFFAFSGRHGRYEKCAALVISRHAGARHGLQLGYGPLSQWTRWSTVCLSRASVSLFPTPMVSQIT